MMNCNRGHDHQQHGSCRAPVQNNCDGFQRDRQARGTVVDSVIMTDNLATVNYSEIDRVIGTFPGMTELED
jgi:hypothetical protein